MLVLSYPIIFKFASYIPLIYIVETGGWSSYIHIYLNCGLCFPQSLLSSDFAINICKFYLYRQEQILSFTNMQFAEAVIPVKMNYFYLQIVNFACTLPAGPALTVMVWSESTLSWCAVSASESTAETLASRRWGGYKGKTKCFLKLHVHV